MTDNNELEQLRQELVTVRRRAERLERIADRRRYSAQLQAALYRIADITAADSPMAQFFQSLHDIMRQLMYAENFFIALYDADASTFSLAYMVDSLDQSYQDAMQNVPISQLHGTLTGYVLRLGKPVFADETVMEALHASGEIGHVGSDCIEWLGCPLKVGNRTLGAMVVQSYDRNRRYRQSDRKLLMFISGHVATAVQRKQADERLADSNRALEAKVEERTHELRQTLDELQQQVLERQRSEQVREACYEIAEQSQTATALDSFYASVHTIVNQLINARDFFIALYDPVRSELTLPYLVDKYLQNPGVITLTADDMHDSSLFTAEVLRTQKPLILTAAEMKPRQPALYDAGKGPAAWLGVPLIMDGVARGAIVVQSHDPSARFTAKDADLLEFVASHVATALQRRQDADSLRTAHHELKTINDELERRIAERTQALANTNSVLEHLLEQRKVINEKLAHDAHHDVLTGLPNRALLHERLGHTIQRNLRRKKLSYALLFLDLDRFKIINDSLGHLSGDKLLCEVSHRLEQCVRAGDTVARLGGDEFCILLDDIQTIADIEVIAKRILSSIAAPYLLEGQRLYTSTSIGITTSQVGYNAADAVIRDADAAMYQAKAQGKNRYCFFDKSLHQDALNRLKLEADLRHAIGRGEIVVYYQPIYDLLSQSIHGFEALARWQHPELGLLSPALFIPVAEETGLINDLGLQVLRDATTQLHAWRQQTGTELSISVNLSGRQLAQRDFLSHVHDILDESELPAQALKLEITESLLIQHFDMAQHFLQRLQEMHIEILLDDFGTGYSSLNYLHQFPLNTVKIDRSFVQQISSNQKSLQLLSGVRLLASNLGLKLVAEGVETSAQLQLLQAMNFEFGQGYLFGAPMPAEQAGALLSGAPHPAFAAARPA
ncbi:EAL domain-containing protein [Permianibacter sp. IMCC34836]|uniref:sensor domain-containing phosphodiesterase n=1 Tax=Permianibacter fluminis TaxID=2738515 RepID=UPI001552BC09|nr:EAL domain-containing protein [Permianibacter fluminis]NQD38697.1 EAL domain-containing protein [Permianibacter fluminis]